MRVPFVQHNQIDKIDAPLHLIQAAVARLPLPRSHAPERQQPRSLLNFMSVSLWPAQRQRAAIGCAVVASHRLATAPASFHWNTKMMQRWTAHMLLRVMGGLVGKIQVRFCVSCSCKSSGCLSVC
jgi:hypothetical protein